MRRVSVAWVSVSGLLLPALGSAAEPSLRQQAESLLAELEIKPEVKRQAETELRQAHTALERARGAHAAGDHTHGALLEGLALEWAKLSAELSAAVSAELRLRETQVRKAELETGVVRARALVEQTVARRGRAAEKLRELELQRKSNGPAPGAPARVPVKAPPTPKSP